MLKLDTASALSEAELWFPPSLVPETTKLRATSTVSGKPWVVTTHVVMLAPRTFERKPADGSDRFTRGYVPALTNAGKYPDEEWFVRRREFEEFRTRTISALEQEPVEDGLAHPVEEVLAEAFRVIDETPVWVHTVLIGMLDNPALAAGLLRCLGRVGYTAVGPSGTSLVMIGLGHDHVVVREAAIVAIEHWARPELASLLASHRERVQWLADYARQVVSDLSTPLNK